MESQDLRDAGLKVTLPRLKILEVLEQSEERHLSAEEIYKRLLDAKEEIGIATVYRVLTQFEDAKLVIRHNFDGGHSVFEMNNADHHDHMVCINCHSVAEFHDEMIERRQEECVANNGWEMKDHSLIIYGVCPACQNK